MGALCRFVHPMSLLQQLKEFLHWDSWVRRASQGEDLPQQHTIRPPEHTQQHTHKHNEYRWEVKRPEAVNAEKEVSCSPDKPMNLLGEILIFNNVYCNQSKSQFDILTLWESQSIFVKINNSPLKPEMRRGKTPQKETEDGFFFVNPSRTELNKDIGANSPGSDRALLLQPHPLRQHLHWCNKQHWQC